MKIFIFLLLVFGIQQKGFSQERFDLLKFYSDYQKMQRSSDKIKFMRFHMNQTAIDSCYRFGFDFTQFPLLNSFSLHLSYEDSVFEAFVIKQLKMNKNIGWFETNTAFQHDFSGFDRVEALLLNEKSANNPSILAFKNITFLNLSNEGEENLINSNSAVFDLKTVTNLHIQNKLSGFPYHAISQFDELKELQIQCELMQIQESWQKLEKLNTIYIDGNVDSIPSFMCSMFSFNNLYVNATHFLDIPTCFLKKDQAHLEVEYLLTDKKEIKKIKGYCKRLEKELPEAKSLKFDGVRHLSLFHIL